MAEILENQVLHTLGQVVDEKSEQNIVSLGIVKDITVNAQLFKIMTRKKIVESLKTQRKQ